MKQPQNSLKENMLFVRIVIVSCLSALWLFVTGKRIK